MYCGESLQSVQVPAYLTFYSLTVKIAQHAGFTTASWSFMQIITTIPRQAALMVLHTPTKTENSGHAAKGFKTIERVFGRLARRKVLSVISVGLLVLLLRLALLPILGIPEPRWHDEFSYILAGKTYALGRLTNPPHPMWIHFESFHIIQQPTYMSMYPPAQGLVLAMGIALVGHPWLGVLLITSLTCAALCWMLQGWLPPGWALLGGFFAAMQLGILTYWMNGYFATSVGALGGVLVLGALPRIRKHCRIRDALIMAFGLVVLANSRPYEGLVFSLPVAGSMLSWMLARHRCTNRIKIQRVVVPILTVLLLAGTAMCYYFWRVTGNPFRMPYQVNRETYAITPYFVWNRMRPEPVYHHPEMRYFYTVWELDTYRRIQSIPGFIDNTLYKIGTWWKFYLWPVLTLPFLAFPWIVRDRKMKFILFAGAVFFLGTVVQTWTLPHYVAPALGLVYIVLLQCMRHMRLWRWRGIGVGLSLVRALPVACVLTIALRIATIAAGVPPLWPPGNMERAQILRQLEHTPGQHLVIVHPNTIDRDDRQCVYNEPDIDSAKVVWARDMGKDKNLELLQYFHDRRIWMLEVDAKAPMKLSPYQDSASVN